MQVSKVEEGEYGGRGEEVVDEGQQLRELEPRGRVAT